MKRFTLLLVALFMAASVSAYAVPCPMPNTVTGVVAEATAPVAPCPEHAFMMQEESQWQAVCDHLALADCGVTANLAAKADVGVKTLKLEKAFPIIALPTSAGSAYLLLSQSGKRAPPAFQLAEKQSFSVLQQNRRLRI